MTMRKILLLRHGQTDWNAQMRFQGRMDIPLNELGMRQAAMAAERIAEWAPEEVYVSPLERAVTTATIAADCERSDFMSWRICAKSALAIGKDKASRRCERAAKIIRVGRRIRSP